MLCALSSDTHMLSFRSVLRAKYITTAYSYTGHLRPMRPERTSYFGAVMTDVVHSDFFRHLLMFRFIITLPVKFLFNGGNACRPANMS